MILPSGRMMGASERQLVLVCGSVVHFSLSCTDEFDSQQKKEKMTEKTCTARDDTSSSSAAALRDGGTPSLLSAIAVVTAIEAMIVAARSPLQVWMTLPSTLTSDQQRCIEAMIAAARSPPH